MENSISIFWFRRDLRLYDNTGLCDALKRNEQVLPLFIFDPEILDSLEDSNDPRVTYLYQILEKLNEELRLLGSRLWVVYNRPIDAFKQLINDFSILAVYANNDYEPYAIERDKNVGKLLSEKGIRFYNYKDQVIFEKDEIVKPDGHPYTIYTPYCRKWKAVLSEKSISCCSELEVNHFLKCEGERIQSLDSLGFIFNSMNVKSVDLSIIMFERYGKMRDIPSEDATSHLSIALRFGTVSIRKVVQIVLKYESFLNELIWREFFMQIIYHYPIVVNSCFKAKYDRIDWVNDEEHFERWCAGQTGFPMVDAGMRELNTTGIMHGRLRMLTASFLTKCLLIDWRWGEAYFARKLMDYELSSNNGNWQWAAGTGCDAVPYFRIFNPIQQFVRFDPKEIYVRRWVPEYGTKKYLPPMIDLKKSRIRALSVYRQVS